MTARLQLESDVIIWTEFAWEKRLRRTGSGRERPGQVSFRAVELLGRTGRRYDREAAFPYDELAHRGRKFLPPRQWGWRLPRARTAGGEAIPILQHRSPVRGSAHEKDKKHSGSRYTGIHGLDRVRFGSLLIAPKAQKVDPDTNHRSSILLGMCQIGAPDA